MGDDNYDNDNDIDLQLIMEEGRREFEAHTHELMEDEKQELTEEIGVIEHQFILEEEYKEEITEAFNLQLPSQWQYQNAEQRFLIYNTQLVEYSAHPPKQSPRKMVDYSALTSFLTQDHSFFSPWNWNPQTSDEVQSLVDEEEEEEDDDDDDDDDDEEEEERMVFEDDSFFSYDLFPFKRADWEQFKKEKNEKKPQKSNKKQELKGDLKSDGGLRKQSLITRLKVANFMFTFCCILFISTSFFMD